MPNLLEIYNSIKKRRDKAVESYRRMSNIADNEDFRWFMDKELLEVCENLKARILHTGTGAAETLLSRSILAVLSAMRNDSRNLLDKLKKEADALEREYIKVCTSRRE